MSFATILLLEDSYQANVDSILLLHPLHSCAELISLLTCWADAVLHAH